MLIEMRDGEWINLQDVKSIGIGRSKVLGQEELKFAVQVIYGDDEDSTSKQFDSREEAYAFAADIVDKLNSAIARNRGYER